MIFIRFNRQFDFEYDIQGIIRSFYPGMELKSQTEGEKEDGYDFLLECDFDDTDMKLSFYDKEKLIDSESFKRIYTDSLYDRKETDYFLSLYSEASFMEDRAEVFASMMETNVTYYKCFKSGNPLNNKASKISGELNTYFSSFKSNPNNYFDRFKSIT